MTKALENAYDSQNPSGGVVFHSDLGSQYTSDDFEKKIQTYKMTHSFSHKGSPYDNACIESFHAILKKEEVNVNAVTEKAELSKKDAAKAVEALFETILKTLATEEKMQVHMIFLIKLCYKSTIETFLYIFQTEWVNFIRIILW